MKITRYIFSDHYKNSSDKFRNIFGLYFDFKDGKFTSNSNPLKDQFIGSEISFSNKEILNQQTGLTKERVVFKLKNTEENKNFLQSLYVNSNDPNVPEVFSSVKNIISNTLKNDKIIYEDLNAETFKVQELNSQIDDFYCTTYSKYNFFIPNYENKISSNIVPEEVLPNFYVVNLALSRDILNSINQNDYDGSAEFGQNSPYQDFFSKFDKFITLDQNILLNNTVDVIFGLVLVAYCEQYAAVYDSVSVDFLETAKKRFGTLLANISNKELLDKINQYKDSYPFYLNIVWSTDTLSPLLEFLKLAGISLNSLQEFINEKILSETKSENTKSKLIKFTDLQINPEQNNLIEGGDSFYTYNAGEWINNFINDIINDSIPEQNMVEHVTTISTSPASSGFSGLSDNDKINNIVDDSNSISTLLNTIVAKPALDQLILRNFRTYKDILDGKLAKTEVLFYKIEKFINEGRTLVQTFYIPNIPETDVQNYVDTQVKYNKEYVYKIYAYTIIYGTSYFYKVRTDLLEPENEVVIVNGVDLSSAPADGTIESTLPIIESEPNYVVIENSSNSAVNFGNSPSQDISFNNFQNSQSILNNFGNAIGNAVSNKSNIPSILPQELNPVQTTQQFSEIHIDPFIFDVYYFPTIKLVELDYTDRLRAVVLDSPPAPPIAEFFPVKNLSNKFKISLSPSCGEIRQFPEFIYSTDIEYFNKLSSIQKTEDGKIIFKYEGEISKYNMFRIENEPQSFLSFSEDPTLMVKNFIGSENALVDEFIEPNKYYYYTFRTYDFHNHFSNPSPVYRVKLFVNDGVQFLDVNVFEFKQAQKVFTKTFKKFLKIDTSLEQKEYSYLDDKLGLMNESVYDQEFILRIKSKHTGKSVDLHFTFNKQNTIK